MIAAATVVALVLVAVAFAVFAARFKRTPVPAVAGDDEWTGAAAGELGGLTESERCDVVFAIGALDDETSQPLLERALGDSSEGVALAAAHALTRRGNGDSVARYLGAHPGERASRISAALAVLSLSS